MAAQQRLPAAGDGLALAGHRSRSIYRRLTVLRLERPPVAPTLSSLFPDLAPDWLGPDDNLQILNMIDLEKFLNAILTEASFANLRPIVLMLRDILKRLRAGYTVDSSALLDLAEALIIPDDGLSDLNPWQDPYVATKVASLRHMLVFVVESDLYPRANPSTMSFVKGVANLAETKTLLLLKLATDITYAEKAHDKCKRLSERAAFKVARYPAQDVRRNALEEVLNFMDLTKTFFDARCPGPNTNIQDAARELIDKVVPQLIGHPAVQANRGAWNDALEEHFVTPARTDADLVKRARDLMCFAFDLIRGKETPSKVSC